MVKSLVKFTVISQKDPTQEGSYEVPCSDLGEGEQIAIGMYLEDKPELKYPLPMVKSSEFIRFVPL